MTRVKPAILAWMLAAVAFALLSSGYALAGFDRGSPLIPALVVAFSGVGALVAARHPRNPVGWIFAGVGLAAGLGWLASSYADRWAGGHGGARAFGELAAVYGNLSWIPFILVPCTFVLLLFPDGRLPSRRWRWVAWCAGAGIAWLFVVSLLIPGPIADYPQLDNPLGVESPVLDPLLGLAYLALLTAIAGSAASLVVRFRRARGDLRQQIKWLALAGAAAAVVVPLAISGSGLWGEDVMNVACMFGVLCLPLAAGAAMLRYRLYDIDVVINR